MEEMEKENIGTEETDNPAESFAEINSENITDSSTVQSEEQTEENGDVAYENYGESPVLNSESEAKGEEQEDFGENRAYRPYVNQTNYEKVPYTVQSPIVDYKPMSKGLKVFALIMAIVILMTGSCAAGYYFGKNGIKSNTFNKIDVDLSAKPKKTDEMTAAEVYEKLNKSIVGIEIYGKSDSVAQATGVIYSKDGYVVTNDHIYAEIPAAKFKIYDYSGKEYDAEYVAGDSISDLALLKIKKGKNFAVPEFGNSDDLVFGESVVAIGRPSDARSASSITKGIISHTKRRMSTTSNYTTRLIQTDSAINPGSSGGALVNMYGQIIGITSSKLAGIEYESLGFAIPTVTMKRVVTQLSEKGKVEDRAKLGITYTEITSLTAEVSGYRSSGLLVASVSSDSDLYGKINKDDIITHVNGEKITDSDVVLDIIDESKAGDTIKVTVVTSKGKTKEFTAKLKANIGESSYSLTEKEKGKEDKDSSSQKIPDSSNPNDFFGGGTFNFPDGE